MIQQKFKPRVQIDKLLYDNQEALDDECFVILSEQPHLINIIEIDLSKLNVSKREISSTTLLKLFLSKYSFNIQKIILGEDKLSDRSKIGIEQDLVALEYVSEYLREQKKLVNEAEYKLIDTQMYKMQNKNSKDNKDKKENKEEKDGKENELKKEGLYEKFLMFNNLKNLKEIQFLSKDLLNKRYLELISRKSHYKLYSTQFDFGIFLYQLSDLYDQMQGDQEEHYELVMKEIDLHGWFEKRQKVLYIDYFIPFTTNMYDAVQQVLIRVEDFSCIEEIRYQCRPNSTTLRYFEYGDSYDVKLAFLNLQRVTINFQICKKLEFDNSYQYQHWNFFKRPFMEYGIFDFSSFYETMFSNFNVDNQRESIKRMFEVICANCPQFIEQIQDMIFYTDPCLENGLILKNLFTIPTQLKWKTISIRARGKDRDESQITLAEKDIQNQIIKSIIEFGHAKINNIESFETVSKITFEQYYDLEIKNIFSKKFNRQQFIENRVELTSHIRINQIVEIRKNSQYYYYQHAFFVPSIKLEEKKKKQKVDVQAQNTNAAPSTPANNQQKPAQNEKGAQNSQIKANQQQQQKKQEQQQHQEQIQQQQQQHQEQQAQDANNHPQSYLQQFQLHRMTKLTKLVIKAHLEWVDFVYLYDKVMPNNPGLQVTFQSTNHRPMIEYLKNTSKEKDGKDWTQEFKYLQLLFTDDKEKKKEQIIQAVVANDSAKYYLQRLDQSDKNQNAQPFTVYLFNVFKALRTGQNDLKQIGNTAQNQTKQSFNAPNSNNQKQNNNAVNNKNNTQQNQQSTNAVQVQHDQPNKEHPTSAKKNFFKFEFYISEIQFIENIEYQKEQEFFKSFPCLLEVTFQKQSINRKLPDKSVENTLSLLEFCRNPITILNVFNLLSSSLQQKHLKQMKNLKEFVKNNIFFISFRYNTFIQIKGIEERRITNLEDNQANEGKDQDQLNKEVSEGDKNINEIQLNDDNVNLQDFQSNDDSGGMSEKLSEKESILIKRKEEDFEDYEQEILKNPINQQNEQEEKQEEKVEEEKDKDEDNKLKDQEEKGKNKNRIYINEMDLNKFLKVFNNLQEIDFSYSSISKEHFQTFFDNLRNNIFDSVVMEGCEVADPEGYLLSVLKFLEENSGKGMKGMQKQQDSDKKKQFI